MKLLILGIDGGDEHIVNGMPMPFLQHLLGTGTKYEATVDLWSRGWAEIFTGHHGRDTGAFYNRPTGDGRFAFTQHFNLDSLQASNNVKPLWDELSEHGFRVGVMNVPTTMPAPKVNGFFVSGVGGGSDKSGSNTIPVQACFPTEISETLEELGYVLDVRRGASGIEDMDEFFERIEHMETKRTDSFIHLAKNHSLDFGFIAYMGISRVSYLLMFEILQLIERGGAPVSELDRKIQAFFAHNDNLFKGLVEQLAPERVLLVSDHGMAAYQHQVNVNSFLQAQGFQIRDESTSSKLKVIAKTIKNLLPKKLRKRLGQKIPNVRDFVAKQDFVLNKSVAFSTDYLTGIYINDHRFGGPVSSDADKIIDNIVAAFNAYKPAQVLGLKARRYASEFKECAAHAFLPDIWIDCPDNVFLTRTGPFNRPNPQYKSFTTFANVIHDMNSGIKGRFPLLCLSGNKIIDIKTESNLMTAYHLALKCMLHA